MFGIILKGSKSSKDEYIDTYIHDNAVPIYNVVRFEESFKIADARSLVKTLQSTTTSGKNRIIVIQADPNTESQNALLKTLEELPDDTKIIFVCEQELLPTIQSRCFVKVLDSGFLLENVNEEDVGLVSSLVSEDDSSRKIILLDEFFSKERENPFLDLINNLRNLMISNSQTLGNSNLDSIHHYLKVFDQNTKLVSSNNLNVKIFSEKIFLTSFS